jgi:hypothetical protein
MLDRTAAVPGVRAASLTTIVPLSIGGESDTSPNLPLFEVRTLDGASAGQRLSPADWLSCYSASSARWRCSGRSSASTA